tara:strand:- start:399 stop:554 length:156 start_codon:yes stop_codon:yes gene_type:complete
MEYDKYEYILYNQYGGSLICGTMEGAMKHYNKQPLAWKDKPIKIRIRKGGK